MKTVTQTMLYRQALINYSLKYGVTKAAIVYCECRRTIYRWREKYDGSLESLKDKSNGKNDNNNNNNIDYMFRGR